MKTNRRIDAPDLPNGGVYAIVHFHDADGSPVEEKDALKFTIIEYDVNDKPLVITFLEANGGEDDDDTGIEDGTSDGIE